MCIHPYQYSGCFPAEISTVQDEPDILVSVFDDFVDHEREWGDIRNGSGVLLIEERHTVRLIHRNRQVEYSKAFIVLGFAEFNDIYVACIAVFVGGIIGNIDPALMIPSFQSSRKPMHWSLVIDWRSLQTLESL